MSSFLVISYIIVAFTINVLAVSSLSSSLSSPSSVSAPFPYVNVNSSLSSTFSTSTGVAFASSGSQSTSSSATVSTPGTASSSLPLTTPFPITASPSNPYKLPYGSNLGTGSGLPHSSNASIGAPYIAFGCTPVSTDPWHDAASCSCQSEVYSWYATQSTGEMTTTVCHTSGEHAYGYYFSAGCSLTTETQLATSWTAPDRCCGYCAIAVPTVRIVYWGPPETVASNVTTKASNFTLSTASTMVEDGFTFTSPSVYVIYSGAVASASCVAMTETYHQVGAVHTTTMAYNSADLSSVACINSLGSGNGSPVKWAPIDYADLDGPIPASRSSARIAKCFTDPSQNARWGDYMQNPFISLPQDISNADPLWSTCSAGILGAMDPPRKLTAAVSMVPIIAGHPNSDPSQPERATLTAGEPVQTAIPGQPVPAPFPAPTGVNAPGGGDNPTKPGTIGPGNGHVGNSPSHNPGHAGSGMDPTVPGFHNVPGNGPALVPPSENSQVHNPAVPSAAPENGQAPNPPPSNANTGNDPTSFQFGQGPQNANPNNMTPAQLSVLYQALSPSPSPAVAPPAVNPIAGQGGSAAPVFGTNRNPQTQPGAAPNPNTQSPDVQLAPISSAIFNDPRPSNNEQQVHNPGNAIPGNAPSGSGNTGTSSSGKNIPQGNTTPGNNNVPLANNAPPANNAAQGAQPGNSVPFAGVASPAPVDQGVPAGATVQPALIKGSKGGLVVGSSTILPGQVATINNHQVSVGPSNVIVGSNTYAFAAATPPTANPITIAGLAMHQVANGGVVVVGQTLPPGAQTTIGGHTISVGSGNVVVDGNIQILPTAGPVASPQILVGGSVMQRAFNGAVVIGGSTLAVGAQTTIAGKVISVGVANVVVDGTTNALPTAAPTSSPVRINGQTMQRAPNGGLIIGTTTLAPGTQTTIAGQVISVGPNAVVMGASTYALAPTAGAVLSSPADGGAQRNAITLPNGAVLSAGGGPVTISGEAVSVMSNDKGAVIDGSTVLFASSTIQSVFTVAGQTLTVAPTGFVVGGVTISPGGPAVTIAGTVVLLGPSGLQIGSSTLPLATAPTTGLGGIIMSAFDAPAATSTGSAGFGPSSTSIAPFLGSANGASGGSSNREIWLLSGTVMLCVAVGALAVII